MKLVSKCSLWAVSSAPFQTPCVPISAAAARLVGIIKSKCSLYWEHRLHLYQTSVFTHCSLPLQTSWKTPYSYGIYIPVLPVFSAIHTVAFRELPKLNILFVAKHQSSSFKKFSHWIFLWTNYFVSSEGGNSQYG